MQTVKTRLNQKIPVPVLGALVAINAGLAFLYFYFIFEVENTNTCECAKWNSDTLDWDRINMSPKFNAVLWILAIFETIETIRYILTFMY